MAGWPIIGRAAEVQHALETLEPGSEFRGVVLVGEPGVGKTTLARTLADTLESAGLTSRFVLGTQTGQAIPLGAFHHSVPVDEPRTPAVMLSAAYRALAEEENLVLVVDDAQWLDPLSAILIGELAVSGGARLIVTIRSGDTVPDAVTALWKERQLLRLDLEAFTHAQTEELVHVLVDGPIDSEVINQLHDLASGNPMFLRGMLHTAMEYRVLVQKQGRWHLARPLRVSADVDGFVARRLESLASDELEVVEIVLPLNYWIWTSCGPSAVWTRSDVWSAAA